MSTADRIWWVTIDGQDHHVETAFSAVTGQIVVRVDGQQVGADRLLARSKRIGFTVRGADAVVEVTLPDGGNARCELRVAGEVVAPTRR